MITRRLREDGPIHSTRKPSRRTSSRITPYWRWQKQAAGPESDAHLATAVKALLAAQRIEGSWEGDPVYQGLQHAISSATQFAVMSLSTLYPGNTKAKNWGCGVSSIAFQRRFSPPTTSPQLSCSELDQYWDTRSRSRCYARFARWRRTAINRWHREAAARALGHMADPGALPVLDKEPR